jgi:YVTN family beta-propeller protein
MSSRMFALFSVAVILVADVAAVNHGTEQYGNLPGYFYIFNSTLTQIIEPSSGKVVKSIPFGVPKYGDAVYAEDQAQLKHYLFVAQSENNKVTVIDTDSQSVMATLSTGTKPLHIFSVYYRDEVG